MSAISKTWKLSFIREGNPIEHLDDLFFLEN